MDRGNEKSTIVTSIRLQITLLFPIYFFLSTKTYLICLTSSPTNSASIQRAKLGSFRADLVDQRDK